MNSCPFEEVRFTLLQAACTRTAARTIANLTSDTPSLSEKDRIEMSMERLSQGFGVRGGFLSEPKIRKYRHGNKLMSLSANVMKEFKDQLDQCFLYAKAYNQRDKLEGNFVVDLAKRLPVEAKHRYLNFLLDKYGSTTKSTYQSLVEFIKCEEPCKSIDFGIRLLGESLGYHENEQLHKSKSACRVRQTTVTSNESRALSKSSNSDIVSHASDCGEQRGGGARNMPRCINCSLHGKDERHWLSSCRDFCS